MIMLSSVLRIRLLILSLLCAFALCVWTPLLFASQQDSGLLQVHFLDVGQGDSILIETPNGKQVLVDGGRTSAVLQPLSAEMGFFDHSIDLVVGTHPDADHIGGLIGVFKRYTVNAVLTTNNKGTTDIFKTYRAQIAHSGAQVLYAHRGAVIDLGASTTLSVLFPESDAQGMDTNTSSIVLQLRYGSTTVMLTGDSPSPVEHYLVSLYGTQLHSDVLKVGHHGSRTATSQEYLHAVTPTYAVISAGAHNRYGHPTKEVMDRLRAQGVIIYSTIDDGTVSFESDGKTIVPEQQYAPAHTIGG